MITKSPIDRNNFKHDIKITNSAREGWRLILQTLNSDAAILLPSYIGVTDREGSGIYDPVTDLGIKHDFYCLKSDLSISILDIEKRLSHKKYSLILLVHYFGFKIRNIDAIVKLCKENNVIVVEDCAHLYNYNSFHISDVGTYGDFAFYSLHKNFPLEKGGLLVQNNLEILSPDFTKVNTKYNFSEVLLAYKTDSIANKRIENFKMLETLISKINGVKSLRKIKKGDIPYNYPIIVNHNLRERLYFWLLDRNITLEALYYRLIQPLEADEYKEMQFLSKNILNLPIHQDIENEELPVLIKLMEEALIELNA